MFISKSLERIADHATNIAEEMIYLAKGKDVRHLAPEAFVREVERFVRSTSDAL